MRPLRPFVLSRSRLPRARWALALLLVVLLAVALWLAFGRRDTTLARIEESGVWRVGMDPSFPPFENLDPASAQPVGFDVDLAHAIGERWGVRVEIVSVGFDQLIDAVTAHRVDAAISALPIFEERTREVAFSHPYFEAGLMLAVPPGSPIAGPDDLPGRRVAAEWGSQGDAEARELQKQLDGEFEVVLKESAVEALEAVAAGEAGAALVDAVTLALFQRDGGELVAAGPPLRSEPYVIVVRAGASRLLTKINDTLSGLSADGTLDEIRRRWLSAG